jgi:hypothetical protein
MMLSQWKATAVKQALGAYKSKKNGQKLMVEFSTYTLIDHIDLHNPYSVITSLHSQICEIFALKRSEIAVILESANKEEWLQKRSLLKHLKGVCNDG